MDQTTDPIISSGQYKELLPHQSTSVRSLCLALLLGWTAVVCGQRPALSAPQSLRSDIAVRHIMDTFTAAAAPSVRIAKDPRDDTLYYLKMNGEIFRVNLATATSTRVYSVQNHRVSRTHGLAIGPDGTMYLVGNADLANGQQTRATIMKGVLNATSGQRVWSILAQSAGYPKSKTAYDHRFNGIVASPSGDFIYVNSGSRTDHGEIQSAGGLFPNTREVGLTACILRLPTNGRNLLLPNSRTALRTAGYLFAEGTRNTFDMAFAPNGDLFGTENGPDRDMSEHAFRTLFPGSMRGFRSALLRPT